MKPIRNVLCKLYCGKRSTAFLALSAATALALQAQTFTTAYSFDGQTANSPVAGLLQGTDGNLYGTTSEYGGRGVGAVFKITPTGTLTTLYRFCVQTSCTDGLGPLAGLIQATDGDFYGTTAGGGAGYIGGGTVFKITPTGILTTLYSFCSQINCTDGANPVAGLVQAANGDFYGTTSLGGANCPPFGCGTIFKITPSGALTTLYSFCSESGCTDGQSPFGGLIQASDGDLYGTTNGDGTHYGTIFKITPSGSLTTLHGFCHPYAYPTCTEGTHPSGGLIQATNGDLYGTTEGGGANCAPAGCGTIFKINMSGDLTTLYSFCAQANCADGEAPVVGLVQATDGNLYGTTPRGGINSSFCNVTCGTAFKITPSGAFATLHSFCSENNCPDGYLPSAVPVQDTDGNLYGTTEFGGANLYGTVFSLSVGLGPFVETQTTSGKVGTKVKILGTSLTGATSVTFNGTLAQFEVASTSEIIAIVPAGATTGTVQVALPSGTLSSNVPFRVLL